jgi:hypothetical protein
LRACFFHGGDGSFGLLLKTGLSASALAEEPRAVPVVELLLIAPASLNGLPRLALLNQGLGLAVLYSLQEKLLPQLRHLFLLGLDSGLQNGHQAVGRARLFKASQPVRQLA